MLFDIKKKTYPIGTKVGYRYRLDEPYQLGIIIGHQLGLYGEPAYPGDRRPFYIKIRDAEFPEYITTCDPVGGFVKVYFSKEAIDRDLKNGKLI